MTNIIFEVPSSLIDKLYSKQRVNFSDLEEVIPNMPYLPNNGYACLRDYSGSQSTLVVVKDGELHPFQSRDLGAITPKNLEQKFLAHSLYDPEISMVTVTGPAGSGKTLLTLAAAFQQFFVLKDYKRLVLTKPRTQVTDDDEPMGEIPGDIIEKMGPQMLSYESAMRKVLGPQWNIFWEKELMAGRIQIIPLEHMRGIDLSDSFVICDEAQNAGKSQYKTLTTRMNASSKLICLGDIQQIDKKTNFESVPLLAAAQHGLYMDSPLTSYINLTQVERGPLVDLMVKIFDNRERYD